MNRSAAFAAGLVVLGQYAPAHAVSETAEGFAAAMQGCWTLVDTDDDRSSQMCLDGDTAGALTIHECLTHDDLTECATQDGRYAFRDEKFWRDADDLSDSCDVFLEPHTRVTLRNCVSATQPGAGLMPDTVYQWAAGQ